MRGVIAISFVLVALSNAVSPVLADARIATSAPADGRSSGSHIEGAGKSADRYWSESSEYFVEPSAMVAINGRTSRKVLITGWHPVEGFETEIAEEAANRATAPGKAIRQ